MPSPTPLTEQIATIVADCKLEGTSANETTRQILEVFTTLTTQHTKEKEEAVLTVERKVFDAIKKHALWVDDENGELNAFVVPIRELKEELCTFFTKDPSKK